MKISFFTDEATQNLTEAIEFAKDNQLQGLEIRSVENRPIHEISIEEVMQWKAILTQNNLYVSNIASSFFKCGINPFLIQSEIFKLTHLCDISDILECDTIRGFTFFYDGNRLKAEDILPYFNDVTEILLRRGKTLLLEADPSVNTSNHAQLAHLLKKLDTRCFGAVYDPGNDLFDPEREEPFPTGYNAIAPYMRHVHIKDVSFDNDGNPFCVTPGKGLVGFQRILRYLKEEGYDGWLSLEPHYRKNTVLTEEQMKNPGGSSFSDGGYEASKESAEALKRILKEINWIPKDNK